MLVTTSLQAGFGGTLVSAGLIRRVTPASGARGAGNTYVLLSADQRLSARASLFGQLTAGGATRVLGSASPTLAGSRLGLRISELRGATEAPPAGRDRLEEASIVASRVAARRGDPAGAVRIRVHAGGARRAALTGDLTGWKVVELDPDGAGGFIGEFVFPGTVARVRLRIDDGAWKPPGGAAVVDDEFGGAVGMLVIQGE
jgi:hypothetical protein